MNVNLTNLFDDFYHTRFFVTVCLSLFTLLFSLKLDKTIDISYWIVFIPLWIWKITALIGMFVGTWSWIKLSRRRFEGETFVQYKAMLISFTTNFILFLFELIVCDKLDTNNSTSWTICFIPLFVLSFISIGTCIWSVRYDRSYEMELFCALNILQFVFVALRLDYTITWSWVLVLIPLWIIMCISLIILLYIIILAIIMTRNNHSVIRQQNQAYAQQNQKCSNAIFFTIFVFSILAFEILLTNKLDYEMYSTDIFQNFHSFLQPSSNGLSNSNNQLFYQNHQQLLHHYQQTLPSSQSMFQQQNGQNIKINSPNLMQQKSVSSNSINRSASYLAMHARNSDTNNPLSYFLVTIPLYMSYFSLICLSFGNHSGNIWWFGMRRDFCELFLMLCPMFQIYGNIQLKFPSPLKSTNSSIENISNEFNNTNTQNVLANSNAGVASSILNTNNRNVLINDNLATEQLVPCLNRSTVIIEPNETRRALAQIIDNDVASNEASLLKFSLLQQMRTNEQALSNDGSNTNTNILVDGNQSINELNLSIDLNESSSIAAPNVYTFQTSRSSSKRVKDNYGDETSLSVKNEQNHRRNHKKSNSGSSNAVQQHYSDGNNENLNKNGSSQVYFLNANVNKDTLLIKQLNSNKTATSNMDNNANNNSDKPVQVKPNYGNIIRLDMPD